MAQQRLSMRKLEEILRLKYEAKLSHRQIGIACQVSAGTISDYVTRAKAAGVNWPLPEGMTEEKLEKLLFPVRETSRSRDIPQLDWEAIHQEMQRKGVTLNLLWVEYVRSIVMQLCLSRGLYVIWLLM